ncbi:MAG: hypothetical protein J6D36_01715 [Erysipelotrichaceae bacterium]|nr:hypothetical protein [Erysipelotrichaceae bacterium]
MNENITMFINQSKKTNIDTQYYAGRVWVVNGMPFINGQTFGAEETFSIGQPVYDEDCNLLGYLGISILENLDYALHEEALSKGIKKIPCENWIICLPTKYCKHGVKVFTFWQYNKMKKGF